MNPFSKSYKLTSTPLFLENVAYEDEISIERKENYFKVKNIKKRSGYSAYKVRSTVEDGKNIIDELTKQSFLMEVMELKDKTYIGVAIPNEKQLLELKKTLESFPEADLIALHNEK